MKTFLYVIGILIAIAVAIWLIILALPFIISIAWIILVIGGAILVVYFIVKLFKS